MRTSIIFLGLVALSLTSVNAANGFNSDYIDQQELSTLLVESNDKASTSNLNVVDTVIFNPDTVIAKAYVKTTEDVIIENKLITESKEETTQPLSVDLALENRIAEDNQIIEGTFSNSTYPLDFEKINKTVKGYNDSAIIVDLKL